MNEARDEDVRRIAKEIADRSPELLGRLADAERREMAEALARVRNLHSRRPHTANGGSRSLGGFDFVHFGQTEFPDLCDHCRTVWPCPTARALATR